MNPKNGKFRVILVYFSFIPLALAAMWLVGGRTFFCKVTVQSNQKVVELQDRLETASRALPAINPKVISRSPSPAPSVAGNGEEGLPMPGSAMKGSFGIGVAKKVTYRPDCSPKPEQSSSNLFCVDPSVLNSDKFFDGKGNITRRWLGKKIENDKTTLFVEETDQEGRHRVVAFDKDRLEFEPAQAESTTGEVVTDVSYSFEIQHTGLKRIYGRFLERSCEEVHRQRLLWICSQLEKKN